ncbi:MAG: PQQ-binding-like beta-propeller repeat protein [Phycisphaerae bacterium]
MRSMIGLTIVAALLMTMIGCADPVEPKGEWYGLTPPSELEQVGLGYYWESTVSLPEGEQVQRIRLLDENVYLLTDANRLVAIDARTGIRKWDQVVAKAGRTVFAPTHADAVPLTKTVPGVAEILERSEAAEAPKLPTRNVVMLNTLDYMVVLDRSTGELFRKTDFRFAANTGIATNGKLAFLGSHTGRYYAVLVDEAEILWTRAAKDMITATPEYFKDKVYVASTDGTLTCLTAEDVIPKVMWRQRLEAGIFSSFHVDVRGCFVPGADQRVHAFDPADGRKLWPAFSCNGPFRSGVQVTTHNIYAYAQGDRFYAINLANGRQRWAHPDLRLIVAQVDENVYVVDKDGAMHIRNEFTGEDQATIPMKGDILMARNATVPAVYTATKDGRVFCIRKTEAGYLKPEDLGISN